jgi:hypothetical protein
MSAMVRALCSGVLGGSGGALLQRMPALFDRCHDALWRAFENEKDTTNLLTLFRYSSLYWRLKGRDSMEAHYLRKLAKTVGQTISEKVSNLTREAAYYLVRAGAQHSADAKMEDQKTS